MTDRELLEKAAKAIELPQGFGHGEYLFSEHGPFGPGMYGRDDNSMLHWNPLTDDRDALRLAVKLHLEIDHNHPLDNDAWVMATPNGQMVGPTEEVDGEENRYAATRRCITRAAAAIGEGKNTQPTGEQHG